MPLTAMVCRSTPWRWASRLRAVSLLMLLYASIAALVLRAQGVPPDATIVGGQPLGWGHAYQILRFEVMNAEDGFPVTRAEIILEDGDGRQVTAVATDDNGVAVVLAQNRRALWSVSAIRIRARGYQLATQRFDSDDVRSNSGDYGLWIPSRLENFYGINMPENARLPTETAAIRAVRNRLYSGGDVFSADVRVPEYEHVKPLHGGYHIWEDRVELQRLAQSGIAERPPQNHPREQSPSRERATQPVAVRVTRQGMAADVYPVDLAPSHWYAAVEACRDLFELGSQWRLPSIDELELIYGNRQSVPNLETALYWSATEAVGADAWALSFRRADGGRPVTVAKSVSYSNSEGIMRVRCVRGSN